MTALRLGAWLIATLAASTPAATGDHPAGDLPTHLVITPGGDAWSGRLRALQFLPTLGTPDAPTPPDLWEAGHLIDTTPPYTRQLWTFRRDTTARTPIALRWEGLSPMQQTELDGNNGLGAARVDYLRGVRQHEHDAIRLRPRTSILGGMRSAHAQLVGPPGFILDPRHNSFRLQHAQRPWMVYIGANDGLLHGFDARTGAERFAVVSDTTLPTAARNASPGQPVPPPVCPRPFVADAWMGAQWHSVLACGNGEMGTGLFLVDITDPTASTPPPMLAYDASDDPTIGHIDGPIPIVPLADRSGTQSRWFAISGNGKGDARVTSRLLLLALDHPRTADAISVPAVASRGGLGAPAIVLGPQGHATLAYAADAQGQIWRFDLSGTAPWQDALGTNATQRRTPFFTATSLSGLTQRILGPILLAATAGGPLLVFVAADTNGDATLYGVADAHSLPRGLSRTDLTGHRAVDNVDSVRIQSDGSTGARGWRIDLPQGQIPDDLVSAGTHSLLLTTRDTTGHERAYLLDPRTGLPTNKDGRSGQRLFGTPLITSLDAPSVQTPGGGATQAMQTGLWQIDGAHIRQADTLTYTRQLGRLSWREVTEGSAR